MRFADDFVVSFQYKRDAERFDRQLRMRVLRGSTWTLADGEDAAACSLGALPPNGVRQYGQKPDTFEFLGFKHVCGTDRRGTIRGDPHPEPRRAAESSWRAPHEWLKRGIGTGNDETSSVISDDDAARLLPVLRTAPL